MQNPLFFFFLTALKLLDNRLQIPALFIHLVIFNTLNVEAESKSSIYIWKLLLWTHKMQLKELLMQVKRAILYSTKAKQIHQWDSDNMSFQSSWILLKICKIIIVRGSILSALKHFYMWPKHKCSDQSATFTGSYRPF